PYVKIHFLSLSSSYFTVFSNCVSESFSTKVYRASSPFFFNETAPSEFYTLSLHDALPISRSGQLPIFTEKGRQTPAQRALRSRRDRKSTRLNSSHVKISYAVFCLKKKTKLHAKKQIHPSNVLMLHLPELIVYHQLSCSTNQ